MLSIAQLTRISLASFLWDTGEQHSPRWDAAERGVPSGAILFTQRNFIEKLEKMPNTPKNESGLTQLIQWRFLKSCPCIRTRRALPTHAIRSHRPRTTARSQREGFSANEKLL